ncbi:12527_t:CDS:2 [Funneliformis geosporum]|nr:12527_t:CDS:2 [Funneliformis geosporum]
MDNINFTFDNLDLHAKAVDSSTKRELDARQDLEVHRKKWRRGAERGRVYNEFLLPYRRNNRIFNNPNERPNPMTKKKRDKEKSQEISETDEITFNQFCQWINIMENLGRRAMTVNYGNVEPKLEVWEFGNCSETNAWTFLCRSDLQIKSRTIPLQKRETKEPCENYKAYGWPIDQENKEYHMVSPTFTHQKICAIMEDTGVLVPEMELKRRVREELAEEKLAKQK